jgi:TetR/AcrR family transcriptional regulator, transcriptional repressor for nem operon
MHTGWYVSIPVGMLVAKKEPKIGEPASRNPERTRRNLLEAAFEEIHKSGFRGTDLETILERAGVTKGALYHYFESKEDLGYAVVDEVIAEIGREKWLRPLQKAENPIDVLAEIFQGSSTTPEHIRGGCPVNNLVLEMSPLDEGFRKRLAKQFDDWREAIAGALRRGQQKGLVRDDLDPEEAAMFLMATYEGYISLAKNSQDAETLQSGMRTMTRYLETLRPKGA